MCKVLVPVDSSRHSQYAVRHVANEFKKNPAMQIHVLNVQTPLSSHITQFSSKRNRDALHREQAEKALMPTRRLLESHGVPYVVHVEVGSKAQMIANTARRPQCTVPVQILAGDAVSRWERYGIPASLGTAAGYYARRRVTGVAILR